MSNKPQPQEAPAQATDFARGLAEHDAKLYGTGFLVDGVRVAPDRIEIIAAAPQPQTPCSDYPNCPNLACPPGCAKPSTPPAHGDGEDLLLVHVGDALSHAFPENIAEWKRVCRIVYPFLRERLTARLNLVARDAARYRWLRLPGNATVYARDVANFNEVPHHPGGHFRYVDPANLDAAIDAALALPAQGEGK